MKKIIIIGLVGLVLVAVGIWMLLPGNPISTPQPAPTPTSTPVATGTLPGVTLAPEAAFPTSTTVLIGTPKGSVEVRNFYKDFVSRSYDKTSITVAATTSYSISYYAPDGSFSISIDRPPFVAVRAAAETAFITNLGISRSDACKLKVSVGTSLSVDPNYAGKNLGLSFCGTGFGGN